MYTENQIQIFVLISSIFIGIFVLTTVFFIVRLKLKDILLKKSEKKLREYSENLEKMVAERTKQLSKSEESYKQLYKLNEGIVENSPAGIIKLDEELKIRYENPEMKRIFGIPSGEESNTMGMDIRELPSVKATGKSSIFNELLEVKEIAIETPFTSLYGKKTYVTLKGVPIFENDKFAGAVLLINDITERKQSEEALKKEKTTLNNIINLNPYSIQICDKDGYHIRENQAFMDLFNSIPPREWSIFNDSSLKKAGHQELIRKVKSGEAVQIPETWYNPHDISPELPDKRECISSVIFPILNQDGEVENIVIMHENLTERKQAEVSLKKEKEYYHSFVTSLTDWVWEIDVNGVHTYSNPAVESILGYKVDEVVGHHLTELWVDDSKTPKILKWLKNTLASGKGWKNYYGKFKHKNGSTILMESTAIPIFNSENKLIGYRGIDHDITERKRADESLKDSEERFRDLFENANDVIWTSDIKGKYLTVNHIFETLLGYTKKELINKQSIHLIAQEDRKKSIDIYQKVISGESVEYEASSFTKTGERKILWLKLRPLKEKRKVVGVHGIGRDITELKKAEEELREAEKAEREVLKELTLKLAHEIKNPLSSISSSAQLSEATTDFDKVQRHMNVINRNVLTCQKVINDLYNFVQKPELKLVHTDITKLLNEIEIYVEALSDKIQLELNIDKKIPMINIDKIRISQAFQNIVNNSLDAMHEKGTLTINARYLRNTNQVLIEFIDTGCGITRENLDRIFHPFYSSKAKGFGLGLSLVKDIINAHKGEISVESKEGKGTKFNIKLNIEY